MSLIDGMCAAGNSIPFENLSLKYFEYSRTERKAFDILIYYRMTAAVANHDGEVYISNDYNRRIEKKERRETGFRLPVADGWLAVAAAASFECPYS